MDYLFDLNIKRFKNKGIIVKTPLKYFSCSTRFRRDRLGSFKKKIGLNFRAESLLQYLLKVNKIYY